MTLKEAKYRNKNLAMAWIDYKRPSTWILECLELFGIAENIKRLLMTSMKSWKTELTSCGEVLTEFRIRRGIQGDSLSPLLFVMSLIPLTMVLRKAKAGSQFNGGEKTNHLLYMDDLKLYA